MQLILQTEPTVDIKKKMSTLGDNLARSQISGATATIEDDVCALTKRSLDKINIATENTKPPSEITEIILTNEKLENIHDIHDISKTNGDVLNKKQRLESQNDNQDTISENVENGCAANDQSNGSLTLTESCQHSNNLAEKEILTSIVKDSRDIVDFKDEEKTTCNLNIVNKSDVPLIENDITANNINDESSALLKDLNVELCNDKQSEVNQSNDMCSENRNIEVSVEDEFMISNESAFSPNSDTNEKSVNISAQLKQLEDDSSMDENPPKTFLLDEVMKSKHNEAEATDVNLKKHSSPSHTVYKENKIDAVQESEECFNEITNQKPSSPVMIEENVSQETIQCQNINTDITEEKEQENLVASDQKLDEKSEIGVPEISDENLLADCKNNCHNQLCDKQIEISAIDANLEITINPLPVNASEDKINVQELNTNVINGIVQHENEKDLASRDLVEQQSVENAQVQGSMEVDNITLTEVTQNNADNVGTQTLDQTDIIIENCTEKAVQLSPNIVKNTEASDTPNLEMHVIDVKENKQVEENMDVDETSSVSLSDRPNNAYSENIICVTQSREKAVKVESNVNLSDAPADIGTAKETEPFKILNNKGLVFNDLKDKDVIGMDVDDVEILNENKDNNLDIAVEKDVIQNVSESNDKIEDNGTEINITNIDETQNCEFVHSDLKTDVVSEVISVNDGVKEHIVEKSKDSNELEITDEEDIKVVEETCKEEEKVKPIEKTEKTLPVVCKLSNTMDILSEDEDDPPVNKNISENETKAEEDNKCINIDDDDDIMFIEDTEVPKVESNKPELKSDNTESLTNDENKNTNSSEKCISSTNKEEVSPKINDKDELKTSEIDKQQQVVDSKPMEPSETEAKSPIIPKTFLKSVTKNLAEMTRNELEDFCILKLVESVVDKSNLNEIKNKMKTMAQTIEDLRKKSLLLSKQNRDLQVVIKTVQENQKKINPAPMLPMKITRSVGMQVVLTSVENSSMIKKKMTPPGQPPAVSIPAKPVRNMQSPKAQKQAGNNIPVPRLVPASSPNTKTTIPVNNVAKPVALVRTPPARIPEKRPHSKSSPASSVTVDLTDDEPPAKVAPKNPTPPVRLVPSQNLMPAKPRPQFGPTGNSPRKVYIPISGPQSQGLRATASVMKNFVQTPIPRPRAPARMPNTAVRTNQANRHPAPLPDAMKQYQPPTWKALPPAPDLKLSKVDNGIVISWKFEGYQTDTYEEVASYQLYAYQETPAPPSTALWKKIGDIKALPLPMACTLTQFMSGFKYYFAVRAIDVRSRIGPFSLPGSIMLISKN